MPLFTVGYSNLGMGDFILLLRSASINAVADVRSSPFSRFQPSFSHHSLKIALSEAGIVYVYLGDQLGGRPRTDDLYDDENRVDYERVRTTSSFLQGIDRVLQGSQRYTIALMCGEEDPLDCHRGLMITPALTNLGIFPLHLRKEGRIETTPEMEDRMLAELEMKPLLFPELLVDAYRLMAKKKAFQRRVEAGSDSDG